MHENNEKSRGSMKNARKLKLWVAAVLSVIVFILVVQNTQAVVVSILFWNLQVSLVILIPFVFLVGMIAGYVVRRKF